jgi:hypothetical protein
MRQAVAMAPGGAAMALRLCCKRIARPGAMPRCTSSCPAWQAPCAVTAAGAVLVALAEGTPTPSDGAHIRDAIEAWRGRPETSEWEARVRHLDEAPP